MTQQLTTHFAASEFRCPCGNCAAVEIDLALLIVLESVREYYKLPVTVTSGHRCRDHNAAVNGAPDSQHLTGHAADIKVAGRSAAMVAAWLAAQPWANRIGLGTYSTFTHVDTRGWPARWQSLPQSAGG